MAHIDHIFKRIEKLINVENYPEFILTVLKNNNDNEQNDSKKDIFNLLKRFLESIFKEIDDLSDEIKKDSNTLLSVKNQKLLRTCFQLVVSFGTSQCLIPGLGISIKKRCIFQKFLQQIALDHDQKYEILVKCTDFFTRSYKIPVLKNIIVTCHLCDYLASLIQLSFAPLKKPGTYTDYTMTEKKYKKLNEDKKMYTQIYEYLVANCFQPTLMKELLVLQNVAGQATPCFVKRVVAKEMSRRLIAPGGVLSMIRCFIERYGSDTGHDWKKIEIICKIVTTKQGYCEEDDYLKNITCQMTQILTLNNVQYLAIILTCILNLYEKYPQSERVRNLRRSVIQCFNVEVLLSKSVLPGTLVLTPQEVEHKVNILHCVLLVVKFEWDSKILATNLYVLYSLGLKCTKLEIKTKINDIILKCLELLDQNEICAVVDSFLYGINNTKSPFIAIEEYEAGLAIKCVSDVLHPKNEALLYFIKLFNAATNNNVIQKLFHSCLRLFTNLNPLNKDGGELFTIEDNLELVNNYKENQSNILQLLTEISSSKNTTTVLKTNPMIVISFVEKLLLKPNVESNEEYVTIALVLLHTVISNINQSRGIKQKLHNLVPALKKIAENESDYNAIISKEILSYTLSDYVKTVDSAYEKAMSDVFNNLLPVRAHGIMELTKLIDAHDPETISKRHYVFCLLQEQLKDSDSYIYLSAINSIAALATHCTEDVLNTLCREFVRISKGQDEIETNESKNSTAELRMKVGDVLVKVTKRLGEMAVVHKATLLNSMLCVCRDEDPLMRTSALSNLAEIALVLHYKMGTIIYEILLSIWSIIETDKAVDCRRAAVMVISSLLKGLGKKTLIELKENLLPIYRTLNKLYKHENEDSVVRLHSQIALEELNSIVNQYLFPQIIMEKKIVLNEPKDIVFK